MRVLSRFLIVCAALLVIVPAAAGTDWSDNFDSYAAGNGLIGQGGWDGWDSSAAAEAFIVDSISLSTPNSVAIIPTTDIVQEFAETAGDWYMTSWSYVPTGSTGKQYFIMLNNYTSGGAHVNADWSVEIEFDSGTGQLTDHYSTSTTPIIYDQWVEVKIDIHLAQNTYDIYYNSAFLASNAWQTGGADAIAALDLFSDGGSTVFWDDCSLVEQPGALEQTTWGNIKTIMQ